jgi:hypothetical protein
MSKSDAYINLNKDIRQFKENIMTLKENDVIEVSMSITPQIPEDKPQKEENKETDLNVQQNEINEEKNDKKETTNENQDTDEKLKENQNTNPPNMNPQTPMPMMFAPPMGMFPLNNQINYQGQNKMAPNMQPFLGFNQLDEPEEEDEPDPILDDDTTDLNTISTFALMENTALIVKKNLVDKKWFLMRGEKVLGNYNSEQLLYFLTSQIQKGNKFEDMSINDHTTDLHFKPSILYDTLRKYVPKLKKRYLKKAIEQNNEFMKKMQQQQQILMQNRQMNLLKMMQMNQNNRNNTNNNNANINSNNNNNNHSQSNNQHGNRNNHYNNQYNNNYHNNNYNNYNNKYHNNHGYHNNTNYNNNQYNQYNQHQGGNHRNANKKHYNNNNYNNYI